MKECEILIGDFRIFSRRGITCDELRCVVVSFEIIYKYFFIPEFPEGTLPVSNIMRSHRNDVDANSNSLL